jgi:hypothetical protein
MVTSAPRGFVPALLDGLAELGPVDPLSGDLSLELGISLWLRSDGTSLMEARDILLEMRAVILEVSGLDPATEPVPLVGRSPRLDVVNLATYAGNLLRRASAAARCSMGALADRVIAELPEREETALGA